LWNGTINYLIKPLWKLIKKGFELLSDVLKWIARKFNSFILQPFWKLIKFICEPLFRMCKWSLQKLTNGLTWVGKKDC